MDLFLKTYANECKKHFAHLGFRRSGNTHWRVINDVYQAFFLQRRAKDGSCQLLFGTIPLCIGIESHYVRDGSLLTFQPTHFPDCNLLSWTYLTNSEDSIASCVRRIMMFIQKYLLPYFERGIDCLSAYNENRKFYIYMQQRLDETDIDDRIFMGDYPEFCMILKSREYAFAEEYMAMAIASKKRHLSYIIQEASPSEAYIADKNMKIAQDVATLERISVHDEAFIQDWIETNELKSLKALGLWTAKT